MLKDKNFLYGLVIGLVAGVVIAFVLVPMLEKPSQVLTPIKGVNLYGQNNSHEDGVAILTEEGAKVRVRVSVSNSPKDVSQPAHIHLGACPNPGAVKFPLNPVVNGFSETVLDTTFAQMKIVGALALNIHKSDTEAGVYTSCGDVKL